MKRIYFVPLFLYPLSLITTFIKHLSNLPTSAFCIFPHTRTQFQRGILEFWLPTADLNTRVCCCAFVPFLNEKECVKDLNLRTQRMRG